jgi:hypothetical protein
VVTEDQVFQQELFAKLSAHRHCLSLVAQAFAVAASSDGSTQQSRQLLPDLRLLLLQQRQHLVFVAPPEAPPAVAKRINAAALQGYEEACALVLRHIGDS